ncbi:MAG TPA: hypothetical protein VMF51_18830 [Nocardioides sp.]|uniref:hypothetical protein n=1 Tax=Nocardioides sp. TaxID=35761 RepID=UPI002CA93D85|nr:hypothetical protein [Nocardioides sp.]HTW17192.1 hypothetical protein [Nocardioides sp.]
MASPPRRHRRALVAAVALSVGGVLGAVLLPTFAAPGGPVAGAPRDADAKFRTVGDGSLPETAPRLREPHEPLSAGERGYAFHLAREAMPEQARDLLGEPGGEPVAADLPPLSQRTSDRRVVVALYDYTADELHQLLVDLTHDTVVQQQATQELQLPPTDTETATALELAITAKPILSFVAQYGQVNGAPLLNPGQVSAMGGAWLPDAARPTAEETQVCGQHRCLQLLIALPTGEYLNTQDFVVDLSTRTVIRTGLEEQNNAR